MISFHFEGKLFNITVIQVYAPTSNGEEAEVEWFFEDLQDLLELTPKKDVLFILGDWNANVGSQETPGVTGKFGLGIWSEDSTHGHHQMVNTEIRFFAAKDGEALYSQQKQERPGADCGSDHELLITKFRIILRKVGKPLDHSGMT